MPRGYPSKTGSIPNTRIKGGDRLIDDPRYKLFHNAKHRAKKKGIPFTITMEDISVPDICPLLNIKIDCFTGDKRSPHNPSLDQIDPGKGYTPDNIQVISSRANWLKADATLSELKLLVERLEEVLPRGNAL